MSVELKIIFDEWAKEVLILSLSENLHIDNLTQKKKHHCQILVVMSVKKRNIYLAFKHKQMLKKIYVFNYFGQRYNIITLKEYYTSILVSN